MSKMLAKMNLISVVQQLKKEDIETIQGYVEMIEEENQELNKENDRLAAKLNKNKILQNEFIKYLEDEIKACNAYSKYVKKKVKELKSSRLGKTYLTVSMMKNEAEKEML